MSTERRERALAEVTREARTEPVPAIDWEALEERLPMTRVKTIPPRPRSWRPALLVAAVSLGALAVAISLRTAPKATSAASHPLTQSPSARGGLELDGAALLAGARVSANDVPQSVVHRGHVTWTLAPHSTALLLTQGDVVAIQLEVGSVTSRVVKSSHVETFAVEAADVRIAAHGTEFVVTLGSDGVSVSVTEGSVLVGPREEPGTGELLASPSQKRFTLAGKALVAVADANAGLGALRAGGARTTAAASANDAPMATAAAEPRLDQASHELGESGTVAAVATPKARPKADARALRADEAAAPSDSASLLPETATPAAMVAVTNEVVALAADCFKQRTATSDGVRVTAQTIVTFRTLPEGDMKSITFEPPLSPWVQVCVNAGMGALRTQPTRYGFQVSRTVDLER